MTQEERKQKSINKILDAAEKHLSQEGIENTDIEKICREAGLTKGAFYHHFGSKQKFLLGLLDKWINEISKEINSSSFESLGTSEIFNILIDRMQPVFEKAGKQLPIFVELYIKAISDESLNEFTARTYNNFISFFSAIIEAGIKKGSIKKDVNPDDTAKILFAIAIGLLIQGLLKPEGADWAGLAKKSIKMLLGS
jgi:AcrR family transcriptional regulator